ncbi:hypothetical protein L7F22_068384 [Adiantum nelumboides]|nr:hypothetical protein [Adiantum nelumboides]
MNNQNGTTVEVGPDGTEMLVHRETEFWLQRSGVDKTLAQGLGKGPDGVALAKIAARGLRGKENGSKNGFEHTPRPLRSLPLASAPKEIQEALVLEDLLFVLLGIEGRYIHYSSSYQPDDPSSRLKGASFIVDKGLDPSFRDLVERVLPLATFYTSIFAFIEMESSLEFGTVAHALCAAIRDLLKEYEVLVVQLEHQLATSAAFTLQKLWFYVHPTLRTLTFVHAFVTDIASISHANIFDSDDEDSDESDDDDDENDDATGGSGGSLEKQKRELLGLDDADEDGVVGGIAKGGEILSMLWDRVVRMSGDQTAHTLFTTLFHRAAQPYARIMVRWITTGHLADTYDEFMIMENPRVTRASLESDPTDEYWERRYTLRDETMLAQREQQMQQGIDLDALVDDNGTRGVLTGGAKVPAFLEPWKRKVLLAGKYLNVLRECGKEVPTEEAEESNESEEATIFMTDESFFRRIESAYQRANSALLHLLIEEHNIVPRLRSMKHYFFQSSSDFFSSFLEAAGRELRKKVDPGRIRDPTIMRLQTHLGMVLGSSSSVGFADPFREDIKVDLAGENAYDQLKRIAEIKGGVEAARAQAKLAKQRDKDWVPLMELLQFDITVRFPVSLVISKKNILRWQFLQRPIIHLKATERSLCDVWVEHQDDSWRSLERRHPELQRWKMRVFRLRHRILFFVQQVLAFVTAEVLEPNWRDLEERMDKAKTVDQFMKDHFDFLNTCRKECMLTDLRYVEVSQSWTSSHDISEAHRVLSSPQTKTDAVKAHVCRYDLLREQGPLSGPARSGASVGSKTARVARKYPRG